MGIITSDMRDILKSAILTFAATIKEDGAPSVSPKGSTMPYDDDHLAFVDIDSPQTIKNLERDPRIEINCIDFIKRRGYRFSGSATVVGHGHPAYEWGRQWLLEAQGPEYPANHVVLVRVDSATPILSPAYTFGRQEEAKVEETFREKYGLNHSAN